MRRHFLPSNGGFSFIELIVVISILSILVVLAVGNYGFVTSKARLQIAVEDVTALLASAQVDAQTFGSQCVGVFLAQGRVPEQWVLPWDTATESCDMKVSPDVSQPLSWPERLSLESLLWERVASGSLVSNTDLSALLFVFEPPDGRLMLWDPYAAKSLTDEGAYRACLEFIFDQSDNPVLQKAVNVVLVTSNFDILGTCGA